MKRCFLVNLPIGGHGVPVFEVEGVAAWMEYIFHSRRLFKYFVCPHPNPLPEGEGVF
jgi:hypothetical protein